ncbi:GtrA family protein [Saccharopolyspora sp. NFXS83]|uniref:GtrA family protein n=1 Tax=Saccharopolyspora sp. NFXS83 TaxID=2993560 RepID=UPI00224B5935|nr:GtrA family protein [Saccharopolyspora sp. NFXS83]MCX2732530.1 GtrA family protein [Saccharopolyspora sp. NFXS83]
MAVAESGADAESKKLGLFQQLFRFVAIGGFCALIDFGTYSLLLGVAGWPVWLSKSISFILGTTASYLINRKFTFSGASSGNSKAKAGAFVVVYTTTFFVNMGSNQLLVLLFDAQEAWQFTLFWVIAQGLGTLINFVMLKWVVFRD